MNSLTLAEKLLSRAAGHPVRAGDVAVCRPDLALGTDLAIVTALDYLARLDGGPPRAPFDARRLVFALRSDAGDDPGMAAARDLARDYAARHGVTLFEVDSVAGRSGAWVPGRALPGQLAVGADERSVSYGALNAFATGVGAADLAGVMYCGQVWLYVPESVRVEMFNRLRRGVTAKDLAVALIGHLGAEGASYRAIEFGGPGVASLDMDDRILLASMVVETGAKAALFRCDFKTRRYLANDIGSRAAASQVAETPDPGALYAELISIDLDRIEPLGDLLDRISPAPAPAQAAAPPAAALEAVHLGEFIGEPWDTLRQLSGTGFDAGAAVQDIQHRPAGLGVSEGPT